MRPWPAFLDLLVFWGFVNAVPVWMLAWLIRDRRAEKRRLGGDLRPTHSSPATTLAQFPSTPLSKPPSASQRVNWRGPYPSRTVGQQCTHGKLWNEEFGVGYGCEACWRDDEEAPVRDPHHGR